LTPYGQALRIVSDRFQEQAIIVLELIALKQLNGERLITSLNQAPYSSEKEVALLTRVFTLVSVETRQGDCTWMGPIDQELMAWNCVIKAQYKTLRNLVEIILTRLYLSGQVKHPDLSYFQRVRLPFFQESSTALGLILKSRFLEKSVDFHARFPNCPNHKEDLRQGEHFWSQVHEMVKFLHKENIVDEHLFKLFTSAQIYLDQRLGKQQSVLSHTNNKQ